MVFGVNSNDDIFYRGGISPSTPAGTNWVRVPGKLSQIDTEGDKVWGANSAFNAFTLDIEREYGNKNMNCGCHKCFFYINDTSHA